MTTTTASDEFVALWSDALKKIKGAGFDLLNDELATYLSDCKTTDEVMVKLEQEMTNFQQFRAGDPRWEKLRRDYVKPLINVALVFNGTAGEAASMSTPGGKAVLVGFGVLLQATKAVSDRYDALTELFEELLRYMDGLDVRLKQPGTLGPASRKVSVDILVQLLNVLCLATKLLKSKSGRLRRLVHFGQSLIGNRDMQDALAHLKRLIDHDLSAMVAESQATGQRTNQIVISAELRLMLSPVAAADISSQDGDSCMENTRVKVLEELDDWSHDQAGPRIFWLDGMAGTGKSAIARHFSRKLHEDGRLGGSFFCSRGGVIEQTHVKRILPTLSAFLATRDSEYRDALLAAVENNPITPSTVLPIQIQTLLKSPFAARAGECPFLVLVVDALDECADETLVRELLNGLISIAPQIPLKFFLTSRPERHIRALLDSPSSNIRQVLRLHDIEKDIVEADIRLYLTDRLRRIREEWPDPLPDDWPDTSDVTAVARHAGKLFIYAFTAIQYVSASPIDRLHRIAGLVVKAGEPLTKPLDNMYVTVLVKVVEPSENEPDEIDLVRRILAAVLTVRQPQTVSSFADLLHIPSYQLRSMLNKLHAVLYVPRDNHSGFLSTFHASFGDFLTDAQRAPPKLFLRISDGHHDLSVQCTALMSERLYFNLSQCPSSYYSNAVQKLADIPTALLYACLHFPHHLSAATESEIAGLLRLFEPMFQHNFLYWLEVLSTSKVTGAASSILLAMIHATALKSVLSEEFVGFLRDANEFCMSSGEAIETSVAHIYISALLFARPSSAIARQFHPLFSHLPHVKILGTSRRQEPLFVSRCQDEVSSVAFSNDGTLVAAGSLDHAIHVWNAHTGEPAMLPLKGHTDAVWSVAFSGDGTRIVSGSADLTIRVWNAQTGEPTMTPIKAHTDMVRSVAFSPDSRLIVSGSYDHTIRLWDAQTGRSVIPPIVGHTDSVRSVTFSPDGARIVSGSADLTIRVWVTQSGKPAMPPIEGHSKCIRTVVCSSDGTKIISSSDDETVRVWDAQTGNPIIQPIHAHKDSVWSVSISGDGTKLVSGSPDSQVRVWNAQTGMPAMAPLIGHTNWVRSVAFSADGTRIASGSLDHTVRMWDAGADKLAMLDNWLTTEPLYYVRAVASSPDGTRIVSGQADGSIRVWDAHTGESILMPALTGHTAEVPSIALSADGTRIISGSWDHTVRVWDAKTGEAAIPPIEGHTDWVWSVAISPDGTRLATGSKDCTIRLWDALNGNAVLPPIEGHSNTVLSVAFSPDATQIVSGSGDCTIRIWDARSGKPVMLPIEGHTNYVESVAFSPDGTRLVSGSHDHTLRMWDTQTGKPIMPPMVGHTHAVFTASFSADGIQIVSCSIDGTVRVWDALTGKPTMSLEGHVRGVRSAMFLPDGTRIISGSDDLTIRVWDVQSRELFMGEPVEQPMDLSSVILKLPGAQGWIRGPQDELLLWIPPEYRGLVRLSQITCCILVMGHATSTVHVDFHSSMHGTDWVKCYDPSN